MDYQQAMKWALKFVITFLYVIDENGKVNIELAVVTSIFLLGTLYLKLSSAPNFDTKVENFTVACDVIPLWVFCCNMG